MPGDSMPPEPASSDALGAPDTEHGAVSPASVEQAEVSVHLTWPTSLPETRRRPKLSSPPLDRGRPPREPSNEAVTVRDAAKLDSSPADSFVEPREPSSPAGRVREALARPIPVPDRPWPTKREPNHARPPRPEPMQELSLTSASLGSDIVSEIAKYTAQVKSLERAMTEHVEACQWRQEQTLGELRDGFPALTDQLTDALDTKLSELAGAMPKALADQVGQLLANRIEVIASRIGMESSVAQRRIIDELGAVRQEVESRPPEADLSDLQAMVASTVAEAMAARTDHVGPELEVLDARLQAIAEQAAATLNDVRCELEQLRGRVAVAGGGAAGGGAAGGGAAGVENPRAEAATPPAPVREATPRIQRRYGPPDPGPR